MAEELESTDELEGLETDTVDALYTFRLPEITKILIDKLPPEQKKILNRKLLVTMARVLHDNEFKPSVYLKA